MVGVFEAQEATVRNGALVGQLKQRKIRSDIQETAEMVGNGSGFEVQGKKEMKRKEIKGEYPLSQTIGEVGTADGFEVQGKKKKRKEKMGEYSLSQTIEELGTADGFEVQGKKKKRKEKKGEFPLSQTIEELGTADGFEVQGKKEMKRKEKKGEFPLSQSIEEAGTADGFEVQGKKEKKRKEKKGEFPLSQSIEEFGNADGFEGHRKKEKKRKEKKKRESSPSATTEVVDDAGIESGGEAQRKRRKKDKDLTSSQTIEDGGTVSGFEVQGKKEKKQKEKKIRESSPSVTVEDVDEARVISGCEAQRKRRKKGKNLTTSQTVEDSEPGTGTAKRTILVTAEPQTGKGAESAIKKKKVTFQLPDMTQDEPSEIELLEDQMGTTLYPVANPWKTDRLRPDLVYGMYTPEEDGALKKAIFDYIQEKGWDREIGLQKVLKSRFGEASGCWYTIRKCLPQREIKRLYTRAHRLLHPGNYHGKWSSEEVQSLIELHAVHGNNWKRIATIIGRDPPNCKDKWRSVKMLNSQKIGPWSLEEQQKLCALVLKCLHVKRQMAKRGEQRKDHRVIRDDISWDYISEQIDGRNRLDCMNHWYNRMASPMVTSGEWSNGDDQCLLERLMEEFPLSEELVEWDSLLEHRSGGTCKRRWEQMQRCIGRAHVLRQLHFIEKLEGVVKRFAPHLADSEYDEQFARELQEADDDESEDVDT